MSGQFKLKLQETGLPSGQIDLRDLADVSAKLQSLATRVGRWVAGIDRVGRSTSDVEETVGLRLTSIRQGSTVLVIERGPALDPLFDIPLEEEFDALFWETFGAIGTDAPRDDTPAGVRESAVELIDALDRAAGHVQVTRADGARINFRPSDRNRSVWATSSRSLEDREVTVSGFVKMVDLDAHKFRLHDDVGNSIVLQGVADSPEVRRLIGERAEAAGRAVRDARGRLVGVIAREVTPARIPEQWQAHAADLSWRATAALRQPDPHGGVEFTDEEWAAFMAAVKGE